MIDMFVHGVKKGAGATLCIIINFIARILYNQ